MKNNIIYKRIVCIVLMAMLLVFTTRIYAANDSFKTTLSADNSSKKRGENVTITTPDGTLVENGVVGTGCKVKINEEYISLDFADILKLKKS